MPLKITLIYLVVGILWIVFSDALILRLISSPDLPSEETLNTMTTYQTAKGWFYVLFTASLLYLLIESSLKKQSTYLQKIRELEIHHAQILKNIPIGIYETDEEGYITYLNKKAVQLTGNTHNQERRLSLPAARSEKSKDLEKTWETAFKNRSVFLERYEISRAANGSSVFVIDYAFPLSDSQNQFSGYIGTLTDATPLRKALQQVSDVESRLYLAIQSSGIGLWHWDAKKDEIRYSAEWKKQLGYTEAEFRDDPEEMRSRLHPDDVARFDRKVRDFRNDPTQPYDHEFRLRHKDGSWRTIYSQATMQFDDNGEPALLIGTHTDITHIKEREQALNATQQRIHHLLEASPTVLYALEMTPAGKGNPTYVSNNMERIFGYSHEEALQTDWWYSHVFPDDKPKALDAFNRLLTTGTMDSHYRFLDKHGNIHWIRDFSRVVDSPEGNSGAVEIIGLFMDMTREHEDREAQKILATAFINMVDGVLITDARGLIDSCNPAFEAVFAYQESELLQQPLAILDDNEQGTGFFGKLLEEAEIRDNWTGHTWGTTKSGIRIPFWLTVNAIRNQDGKVDKLVFIFRDMSAINEKEAELTRMAQYDKLTELPNREFFNTQLTDIIRKAGRNNTKLALLFIDLDDFKDVNDSLGYDYGDALLVRFSSHLKSLMQDQDILARMGGDEFIVLMECDEAYKEAMAFGQTLLDSLDAPFLIDELQTVYITPSIGISLFPQNGRNPEKLIQCCNMAMNHSKAAGKNTLCFFTEEMEQQVNEQIQLINGMREAINNHEYEVYYQPKLNIGTQHYAGAEALIRWRNSKGETVSPGKFIPLAESSGLITRIGDQVLTMVARQIRTWLDAGHDPGVISINISVKQFLDPDLVAKISNAMTQYNIPASNLAIEITESALMTDPGRVNEIILALQALDLEIHLDDFGTGFSSFSYLSRFVLNTLKIDMSFVRHIDESEKDNQIILSMLNLASHLGMTTIAEGVEEEAQVRFLERHGCNAIQGYLYSAPLPVNKFEAFVFAEKTAG